MKSMTGFGRGAASGGGYEVAVELSSVNRRQLDVSVSLPKDWQSLERQVAEQVRSAIGRGAVRAVVQITTLPDAQRLAFDEAQVHRTLDRLKALADARWVKAELDYETLLKVVLLHKEEGASHDTEAVQPLLAQALDAALKDFIAMRTREGAALTADMEARNAQLQRIVTQAKERVRSTAPNYRELLMARLRQANLEIDLSDERVLKEIAIFADRVDTSEEVTRLESHLEQFADTLVAARTGDEPVGRKLEFILQEINREFNTIGSKANNIEVTRLVIEAKNEVERQREQVQNVE